MHLVEYSFQATRGTSLSNSPATLIGELNLTDLYYFISMVV
jgi:hypothetical protein